MSILASLAFDVQTKGIKQATTDLKSMEKASGTAITSAGILKKAVAGVGFTLLAREVLEYNTAIAEVSTIVDKSSFSMKEMTKTVEDQAKIYGGSLLDNTKAYYNIVSAGIDTTERAAEALDTANKLSVAGITSVGVAVDGLTSVNNAYAGSAGSFIDISDKMFAGVKAGKTTVDALAQSVGKVSPIAAASGVSFSELTAAISTVTSIGVSTSEAVTGVKAALVGVLKPSSEATRHARSIGLEFNAAALESKGLAGFLQEVREKTGASSESLNKLFGSAEAATTILTLTGKSAGKFADTLELMANSAGMTDEAFAKMNATFGQQFSRLLSIATVETVKMGNALADYLAPVLYTIADVADVVLPKFFKGLTVVYKAIADLISISAKLVSSFLNMFSATEKTNGELTATQKVLEGIKGAITSSLGFLAEFSGAILSIASAAVGVKFLATAIGTVTVALRLMTAAALANPLVAIITGIATSALLIYENWDGVVAFFEKLWSNTVGIFERAGQSIVNVVTNTNQQITASMIDLDAEILRSGQTITIRQKWDRLVAETEGGLEAVNATLVYAKDKLEFEAYVAELQSGFDGASKAISAGVDSLDEQNLRLSKAGRYMADLLAQDFEYSETAKKAIDEITESNKQRTIAIEQGADALAVYLLQQEGVLKGDAKKLVAEQALIAKREEQKAAAEALAEAEKIASQKRVDGIDDQIAVLALLEIELNKDKAASKAARLEHEKYTEGQIKLKLETQEYIRVTQELLKVKYQNEAATVALKEQQTFLTTAITDGTDAAKIELLVNRGLAEAKAEEQIALENLVATKADELAARQDTSNILEDNYIKQKALRIEMDDSAESARRYILSTQNKTQAQIDAIIATEKTTQSLIAQKAQLEASQKAFQDLAESFVDIIVNASSLDQALDDLGDMLESWILEQVKLFATQKLLISIGADASGYNNVISQLFSSGASNSIANSGTSVVAGSGSSAFTGAAGAAGASGGAGAASSAGLILAAKAAAVVIVAAAALEIGKAIKKGLTSTNFEVVDQGIQVALSNGSLSTQNFTQEERERSGYQGTETRTTYSEIDASTRGLHSQVSRAVDQIRVDTVSIFAKMGTQSTGAILENWDIASVNLSADTFAQDLAQFIVDATDAAINTAIQNSDAATRATIDSQVDGGLDNQYEEIRKIDKKLTDLELLNVGSGDYFNYTDEIAELRAQKAQLQSEINGSVEIVSSAIGVVGKSLVALGFDFGVAEEQFVNSATGMTETIYPANDAMVDLTHRLGGAVEGVKVLDAAIANLAPTSVGLSHKIERNNQELSGMNAVLEEQGFQAVYTKDQAWAAIQAQDENTESGRQNIAMIMLNTDNIVQSTAALERQAYVTKTVIDSLEKVGAGFQGTDDEATQFAGTLTDLAGGVEAFASSMTFYFENMFSDVEQAAINATGANSEIDAYNKKYGTNINNKSDLRNITDGLDPTNPNQQQQFNDSINLAPATVLLDNQALERAQASVDEAVAAAEIYNDALRETADIAIDSAKSQADTAKKAAENQAKIASDGARARAEIEKEAAKTRAEAAKAAAIRLHEVNVAMIRLHDVSLMMGLGFDKTSPSARATSEALIDLYGSLDATTAALGNYYDKFYSESEKSQIASTQATAAVANFNESLGLSGAAAIDTKEEMRQYTDGLLAQGPAGAAALKTALDVSDSMILVADSGKSLNDNIASIPPEFQGMYDGMKASAAEGSDALVSELDQQLENQLKAIDAQLAADEKAIEQRLQAELKGIAAELEAKKEAIDYELAAQIAGIEAKLEAERRYIDEDAMLAAEHQKELILGRTQHFDEDLVLEQGHSLKLAGIRDGHNQDEINSVMQNRRDLLKIAVDNKEEILRVKRLEAQGIRERMETLSKDVDATTGKMTGATLAEFERLGRELGIINEDIAETSRTSAIKLASQNEDFRLANFKNEQAAHELLIAEKYRNEADKLDLTKAGNQAIYDEYIELAESSEDKARELKDGVTGHFENLSIDSIGLADDLYTGVTTKYGDINTDVLSSIDKITTGTRELARISLRLNEQQQSFDLAVENWVPPTTQNTYIDPATNMINGVPLADIRAANDSNIDGSHRNGIDYINTGVDGVYNAELHQGERVLTREENEAFSAGEHIPQVQPANKTDAVVVNELRELRKDLAHSRDVNEKLLARNNELGEIIAKGTHKQNSQLEQNSKDMRRQMRRNQK